MKDFPMNNGLDENKNSDILMFFENTEKSNAAVTWFSFFGLVLFYSTNSLMELGFSSNVIGFFSLFLGLGLLFVLLNMYGYLDKLAKQPDSISYKRQVAVYYKAFKVVGGFTFSLSVSVLLFLFFYGVSNLLSAQIPSEYMYFFYHFGFYIIFATILMLSCGYLSGFFDGIEEREAMNKVSMMFK